MNTADPWGDHLAADITGPPRDTPTNSPGNGRDAPPDAAPPVVSGGPSEADPTARATAPDHPEDDSGGAIRGRLDAMGHPALSTCVADVEPEDVQWLWPARVPYAKITVLDGDPGLGKSTITLDITARLTTGTPLPGDLALGRREPVSVLLLNAEDGVADTIRPRLEAAGADLSRVHVMAEVPDPERSIPRPVCLPDDLAAVEAEAARLGAGLVVVDPLMAFLGSEVNAHRDQDVRRVLHALKLFAERTGAAVVVVRHLNKSGGTNALYRGGGSIGIVAAARAGLMVAPDPDDETGERRVLAVTKSNLAAVPPSLAYRLVTAPEQDCARVAWDGESGRSAADLLRDRDDDEHATKVEGCAEALRTLLEAKADTLDGVTPKEAAAYCADAGFSHRTYERARKHLGVRAVPPDTPGRTGTSWRLELPDTAPSTDPDTAHVRQNPRVGGHDTELPDTGLVSPGQTMSALSANGEAPPMSAKRFGGHGEDPPTGGSEGGWLFPEVDPDDQREVIRL